VNEKGNRNPLGNIVMRVLGTAGFDLQGRLAMKD
jgi:hypothetical protein